MWALLNWSHIYITINFEHVSPIVALVRQSSDICLILNLNLYLYLIKNSQAVKKGAAPKKAMVKKDVKSKVAAKKWL